MQHVADNLRVAAVEQRGHGQLIEAGNEDQEPARRDGGENQRNGDLEHRAQPSRAGRLGAFLQGHMDLAHGRYHRAHAHHEVLDEVGDDHDGGGVIEVDAELAVHGHDQAQGDYHAGRAGPQSNEEVGNLAPLDPRALQQIRHGKGNHDTDGRGCCRKGNGIDEAFDNVVTAKDLGPVHGGKVVGLKKPLAKILLNRGGSDGDKGDDDNDDGEQADQHGGKPTPSAQINNIGTRRLAGNRNVLLARHHNIGDIEDDNGHNHQEHSQARGIIDTILAQAHILHNACGYGIYLARLAHDGGNAVAAGRAHEYQQGARDEAGGHHGQRNSGHGLKRRGSADAGRLLQ